jgi:hypothetical protein
MKRILILVSFFILASQQVFAVNCPSTFEFGTDKINQFVCIEGTWNADFTELTATATHVITNTFTMARNNGVAPECVVNDPNLTTVTTGDDRLDTNKVVDYCRSSYPNTMYIGIPYGCDKTGVNHCDSTFYYNCYYRDSTTDAYWTKSHGDCNYVVN